MHVDFYFDYSCPYAYLGATRIEAIAARTGATLAWKPMLLGGVFAAVGTAQKLFATLSAPKAMHNATDLQRWADRFEVPLTMPAAHPFRTVEALRATIATGNDPKVIHGFYRAYWVDGLPISEESTLRRVLVDAEYDADAVLAQIRTVEIKDALRARTDAAVALGIFGAPAMIIDGELEWGQDRLDVVERRLSGASMAPGWGLTPSAPRVTPSTHTLEVYFDFSSPWGYLGTTQIDALAARTGATIVWRPLLLGGLFKSLGQSDVPLLAMSAAKQRWMNRELERYAARWGVPFRFPSRFPLRSVELLRIWFALPEARRAEFTTRTMRAIWADDADVGDESVLASLIGDDHAAIRARAATDEIKSMLRAATEAALRANVFGVPTFVVDGRDLYWGQDRLDLVEEALGR
jgi:2-hydroxychromene-2-carboxylate isomerase